MRGYVFKRNLSIFVVVVSSFCLVFFGSSLKVRIKKKFSRGIEKMDTETGTWFYIWDTKGKKYELIQEKAAGGSILRILYAHRFGRFFRHFLTWGGLNYVARAYYTSSFSKRDIKSFIKQFEKTSHPIVIDEAQKKMSEFRTFNDFFTRKIQPKSHPINTDSDAIVSPADSKLFVIDNIQKDSTFFVKGTQINLSKMLCDFAKAEDYYGGTLMVFRLAPYDYHRYHFPIDCRPVSEKIIKGRYESVNPLVYRRGIFALSLNRRHLVKLKAKDRKIGDAIFIAVGALIVGGIKMTYDLNKSYEKGDEAGFFDYGGSTVVLLFKPDTVEVEQDFLDHSHQVREKGVGVGYETAVRMGQKIAVIKS